MFKSENLKQHYKKETRISRGLGVGFKPERALRIGRGMDISWNKDIS